MDALNSAARLLRDVADELKSGHTKSTPWGRDWCESEPEAKALHDEFIAAADALDALELPDAPDSAIATHHMKEIYDYLCSIAPPGIADEAFRNVPDSLLPDSQRTALVSDQLGESDEPEKRMGLAQQDRRAGAEANGVVVVPQPVKLTDADVRAVGGIIHRDGNVFFTNIEQMNAAIHAKR